MNLHGQDPGHPHPTAGQDSTKTSSPTKFGDTNKSLGKISLAKVADKQ